jgi:hypothetical protein
MAVDLTLKAALPSTFPTCGSVNRIAGILCLEKEGFQSLLEQADIARRFDLAILANKGQSTIAARRLVDQLKVPLLLLHDFDEYGFSIAASIQNNSRRYTYENEIPVFDLGVRLCDVKAWSLQDERVPVRNVDATREKLKRDGATCEEIEFLCSGRRVELNAFTAPNFIKWLEQKIEATGIKRVMPSRPTLATAYRRAAQVRIVNMQLQKIIAAAGESAKQLKVPKDLQHQIEAIQKAHPEKAWDHAIADIVAAGGEPTA